MSALAPRADRSSIERVRPTLEGRISGERGDQIDARCPAHDDHDASLSVTWKVTEKGGQTFLFCHRGCDVRDVAAALGLRTTDLYDTPPARPEGATSTPSPRAKTRRAVPAKAPVPVTPARKPVRRPDSEIEARHPYTDAEGTVLFWVIRWQPAEDQPRYTCRRPDPTGRRAWLAGTIPTVDRVLYQLPDVLRVAASGGTVWLTEGEKDADAVNAALATAGETRAVATSAPFGAPNRRKDGRYPFDGKWLPQYTAALAGAHVVIWYDNDPASKDYPGQRYAAHIAAELADVAASVRLVRSATGKDADDHLGAGHTLAEVVDVPLADVQQLLAAHDQTARTQPTPGTPTEPASDRDAEVIDLADRRRDKSGDDGPGGGEGSAPPRVVFRRDQFAVYDDSLCKVTWEVRDAKRTQVYTELVNAVPVLRRRLRYDLGDGERPRVTHFDLAVTRDGQTVTIDALDDKEWRDATWAAEMPWPLLIDDTANGRAKLRKAIVATSGPVPVETLYGKLGWWQIDGRWVYLHAAGAITAAGVSDRYPVKMPQKYQPFALPGPAEDREQLRRIAQAALIDPMESGCPARLMAPMLAAAWRATLGYSRVTLVPCGNPASGKTGLAAIGQQFHAPGARFRHLPFGAGEQSATVGSLEFHRYVVGDMLQVLDDLAADTGTEQLGRRQNALARSQAERRGKDRRTRDMGLRAEHQPNGLLVLTTEQWAGIDSAESRIVALEMHEGEIDPEQVFGGLDKGDGPQLRGAFSATLAQHYADRMPLDAWLAERRDEYAAALRDPDATVPGREARRCEAVADLAAGARAALDMLTARGALTPDEAAMWWDRLWAGLKEAKTAMTGRAEERRPHQQILDLLRSTFLRKKISLEDAATGTGRPGVGAELVGWEKVETPGRGDYDATPTWRRVGEPVGWTDADLVYLRSVDVTSHLAAAARAAGITWTYNETAIADHLAAAGLLSTEVNSQTGRRRNAVRRRIGGHRHRVWEMSRDVLWPTDGDEDDDPQDGGGDQTPPDGDDQPTPPSPAEDSLPAGSPDPDGQLPLDTDPAAADSPAEPTNQDDVPPTPDVIVCDAWRATRLDGSRGWQLRTVPDGPDGLARLLDGADTLLAGDDRRLWLLPEMSHRLDLPALPQPTPAHVQALAASGWHTPDQLAPVTVVTSPTGNPLTLILTAWLPGQPDPSTLDTPALLTLASTAPEPLSSPQSPAPAPVTADTAPTALEPQETAEAVTDPDSAAPTAPEPVPGADDVLGEEEHADRPGWRPYDGPALVCDPDQAWLARTDGAAPTAAALPDLPTGPAALGALLSWAETTFHLGHKPARRGARSAYGQVWITSDLRARLGLPRHLPDDPDAKTRTTITKALQNAGWQITGGGIHAWTTVYRIGGRRAVLVIPDWLREGTKVAVWGEDQPDTPAETIARRLGLYVALTGIPHQWSPAITGTTLLAATRPRLMAAERPELPPPAMRPRTEDDFGWARRPEPHELQCAFLVAVDKFAAHLGSASSLTLGYGAPTHYPDGHPFDLARDRNRPGYWRIRIDHLTFHPLLPNPLVVEGINSGRKTVWVTTPTMRNLVEHYEVQEIDVREAWLWPTKADDKAAGLDMKHSTTDRLFEMWYETLRDPVLALEVVKSLPPEKRREAWATQKLKTLSPDLLAALHQVPSDHPDIKALRSALKGNYAGGIGRLDAMAIRDTGHRLWRPDFRHHVLAQTRYALSRKMVAAAELGHYPLAVLTDCIVYAVDNPDPVKALGGVFTTGHTLKDWHVTGVVPMAEAAHLLGDGQFTPTRRNTDGTVAQWGLLDTIKGNHRTGDAA